MEVLRGSISNLQISRRKQDFVLSEAQHAYMEATAVGGAAIGLGASAMGLLQMSANSKEEADWVEFELDGKRVKGWLWKMPMCDGDYVEIVAEPKGKGEYFAYALRRPDDGIIAVYPHATNGRAALYRRIMKYMLWLFLICFGITSAMFYSDGPVEQGDGIFTGISAVVGLLMFWILFHRAYLKMSHFAKLAEVIFSCYGWCDVRRIDLARASKAVKPANADPTEFGVHYFRYQPEAPKT
ncbi:MAG TPA: putative type VI secretion system effector [Candidatus Sulfotelmatobacter sp.]|nr:putative type VI secretion system effector [Candidatus Sulfotelmatobacter sp.]